LTLKSFQGRRPRCGNAVYVADSAVVVGDVTLGDDVSIWPMAVVRGDVESIEIGAGTNVQDGSVLHVTHAGDYSPDGFALSIGRGVTIGHRAVVHGCTVRNHCLIGIGAVLMDGAVIEEQVLIGAGALVPPAKRLESGHLYVGSPAKQVRALNKQELEFLIYSARHYMHLKDCYIKDAAHDG
jgi:carbonic anhydrase/acetyltransferase-like protein (isoleucine patch superfamily)